MRYDPETDGGPDKCKVQGVSGGMVASSELTHTETPMRYSMFFKKRENGRANVPPHTVFCLLFLYSFIIRLALSARMAEVDHVVPPTYRWRCPSWREEWSQLKGAPTNRLIFEREKAQRFNLLFPLHLSIRFYGRLFPVDVVHLSTHRFAPSLTSITFLHREQMDRDKAARSSVARAHPASERSVIVGLASKIASSRSSVRLVSLYACTMMT